MGWLLRQLVLQAEGLGGHLAHFWPDVMDSVWVGGSADGGLHERAPYWLNGIVPLAFLLRNGGITQLGPFAGVWKAPAGKKGWPPGPLCDEVSDTEMNDDLASSAGYLVSTPQQCRDECARMDGCRWFVIDACHAPAGRSDAGAIDGPGPGEAPLFASNFGSNDGSISEAAGAPNLNLTRAAISGAGGGLGADYAEGPNVASAGGPGAAAATGTRCWLKGAGARPGAEKILPGAHKIPPGGNMGGEKIPPREHPGEEIPAGRGGCRCRGRVPVPFAPVDLMEQATQYINYILGHQARDQSLAHALFRQPVPRGLKPHSPPLPSNTVHQLDLRASTLVTRRVRPPSCPPTRNLQPQVPDSLSPSLPLVLQSPSDWLGPEDAPTELAASNTASPTLPSPLPASHCPLSPF
jgi:hypothetical protein